MRLPFASQNAKATTADDGCEDMDGFLIDLGEFNDHMRRYLPVDFRAECEMHNESPQLKLGPTFFNDDDEEEEEEEGEMVVYGLLGGWLRVLNLLLHFVFGSWQLAVGFGFVTVTGRRRRVER